MLEKEIELRMGRAVKAHGGLFYKFVSPGNAGVPDRIIITPAGRVVFVELKTEHGIRSEVQIAQALRLRRNNAEVHTVYGLNEALALVEEVMST